MKALDALCMYGPEARLAVPAVVDILRRSPPKGIFPGGDLENSINLLAEIGPDARTAVPALVALLPIRRIDIQLWDICRALGNMGPDAAAAVPALKQLLQHGNLRDQVSAAAALARIDPGEKSFLAPLLISQTNFIDSTGSGIEGKDPRIYWPAAVALWRFGLEKEPPIAEMMPPTTDWQILVAIPLLGDIGPAAKSALPYLEGIVDSDPTPDYRRMAAIAIRKIDPMEAEKLQLPGIFALP